MLKIPRDRGLARGVMAGAYRRNNVLQNISIKVKLIGAFAAVAGMAAVVAFLGWYGLNSAKATYDEMAMSHLPAVTTLTDMQGTLAAIQRAERTLLIPSLDAKEQNGELTRLRQDWDQVDRDFKIMDSTMKSAEQEIAWKQSVELWNDWKKQHQSVIDLIAQGTPSALKQASDLSFGQTGASLDKVEQQLSKLLDLNQKSIEVATKGLGDGISSTTIVLFLAAALGTLTFALGVFLTLSITNGINRVVVMLKDMAQGEGDLTKRLEVGASDEVGELCSWFNTFVDNLYGIIEQIAVSTERIASASEELSATTEQFSSGADTQLQQSQQIASAMHEMSASILEVAKNAQEAAIAAEQASDTAQGGSRIVGDTIEGIKRIAETVDETAEKMAALGESSSQIGEIIGVIDDIADQTNLLALNAAIEAARAGEQGRGFAVVADEVRKLAERTTKATKEIATMITNIQRETQLAVQAMEGGRVLTAEGVDRANRAETALSQIVQVADRVGGMVTLIATAAEQQSSASEEINASVENITMVIRQTGEGAHQSAKATEELAQLALDQQSVVGRFKLARSSTGPRLKAVATGTRAA
ncbi:MAG: methyl-accepting chemotaxis protein [Chloroflexota bacterium]|nr:MAG: methyl-accepting chemotaxis protein [Chloroflexota bacterium]